MAAHAGEGGGVELGPGIAASAGVGALAVDALGVPPADEPVLGALVHVVAVGEGVAGVAGLAGAGELAGGVGADGVGAALAPRADGLVALVDVCRKGKEQF